MARAVTSSSPITAEQVAHAVVPEMNGMTLLREVGQVYTTILGHFDRLAAGSGSRPIGRAPHSS